MKLFLILRTMKRRFFPTYERLELLCVSYEKADKMIRDSVGKPEDKQWDIAIPEEDYNRVIGVVYLERKRQLL